jgi:DNA-binding transcriptional LysR family regulator
MKITFSIREYMEIAELRIFQMVAETGGITAAAARLHRVPSNITTRIRQLEEKLGVALFSRENNRLKLSPDGKMLLEYCGRILALVDHAQQSLLDPTHSGPFRLGTLESVATTELPRYLAEYHRQFPDVQLELKTGPTAEMERRVLAGELDAAIVAKPGTNKNLNMLRLFEEELVLVTDKSHPPVRTPKDVARSTVLTFGSGCTYRKVLETWFADAEIFPDRIVEFSSYYTILSCAVVGMGVAIMPRKVFDAFPNRAELKAHQLPLPIRKSPIALIWKKEGRSLKVNTFLVILNSKPLKETKYR